MMAAGVDTNASRCGICGGEGAPWLEKHGYPILLCSSCHNGFVPEHMIPEDLEALYSKGYEWTWLDCLASLYAGDLHNRECLAVAHEALRTRYQVPESALEFFRIYLADADHDIE